MLFLLIRVWDNKIWLYFKCYFYLSEFEITRFDYFKCYFYFSEFEITRLDCILNVIFTAGYNNVEVAEFLLENGADVNAQDKGGLIPLHNASSYGVSNTKTVYVWWGEYLSKIATTTEHSLTWEHMRKKE